MDSVRSHAEADDTSRKNIHDQHHPIAEKENRFAAAEINTSEAVLGLSDERQPRGTMRSGATWTIMLRQDATNVIFVDRDPSKTARRRRIAAHYEFATHRL
jgi:hypothetical protein